MKIKIKLNLIDMIRQNSNIIDGNVVYNEGWCDEEVHKRFQVENDISCSMAVIRSTRYELFGPLAPKPKKVKPLTQAEYINTLEKRIDKLERFLRAAGYPEYDSFE